MAHGAGRAPLRGLYLQPVGGDILVEQRQHVRLVAQQHVGAARSRAQPADAGASTQLEHTLAAQRSPLLLQQRRHLSAAVPDPCTCGWRSSALSLSLERVRSSRAKPSTGSALAATR